MCLGYIPQYMIISSCYSHFNLYSINSSYIWLTHYVHDQNKVYLIHSYCVWSIWPIYDLFTLYLIDITWFWLNLPVFDWIWSVYAQFNLALIDWTCNWSMQPAIYQDYIYLISSTNVQFILNVFNGFYVSWIYSTVHGLFYLYLIYITCAQSFQPLFNQFILYLANSTCVWPKQHVFDPFLLCLIYLTYIWSIHPLLNWSNLVLIEFACTSSIWSIMYNHLNLYSTNSPCIWHVYDQNNLYLIYSLLDS